GTPAGEYTLVYQICEKLNLTNCDSATVTVKVTAAKIDAKDDVAGPINGKVGGDAGINILDNDELNGTAVNPADVVITSTPNGPLTVNTTDGTVAVAENTPAGTYTVQYTICEVLNPGNCDTATVTVTVEESVINAVDDFAGPINGKVGGDAGINILDNDELNGTAVNPADVVITSTPNGPLTVNPADGTVTVAANTPAGDYTVQYTICEVLNPANCDTATVTVTVEKSQIDAIDDVAGPINGVAGGDSGINVLDNDTLNGTAVNPADVFITSTPNGPLTVNIDGTVTVAPNTPAGDYTVQYTICEVLNPANCDTATVTVTVEKSPIDAVDDIAGPINGNTGGTTPSVLTNDTLNGIPVNPADVVITSTPNGPLTVNPVDGTVTVAPNTPAGDYTVQYTICEVLNPANCDTATVTVTVEKSPIDAVDDIAGPINGNTGGTTPSVLTNDTLNGTPVNPADVVVTSTPNGPLTMNPADGTVTVAPNTPAGDFTVQYTICEVLNPTNCDTATVTISVFGNVIQANSDNFTKYNCEVLGADTSIVGNIFSNDTLNGTAVKSTEVNYSILTGGTLGISIDNSGYVIIGENVTVGTYNITYEICDKVSTGNCSTATLVINVVGVTNGEKTLTAEACNTDTLPIDLATLLPAGVPTTGTWIDDSTGKLVGSEFTPLNVPTGSYIFKYFVETATCPINYALNMTIKDDCGIVLGCGAIKVHNAFTPNGDGINDIFVIDNIDDTSCYPENTVEIYNRWGVLVYEVKNYNNQNNAFIGISHGRTTISQSVGLPVGTYFYILNYLSIDGSGKVQTNKKDGYLYLTR
ncbi:gliding motility-associated C-terminal domain-containing protein, partial [Flavobacterium sp. PL002]|uniref:gliding motility-associated C-terminal domain-containing protein n=1 Tax=Flavobacterium sp. PL002 TaxID=1897058 RepID=UPI001788623E